MLSNMLTLSELILIRESLMHNCPALHDETKLYNLVQKIESMINETVTKTAAIQPINIGTNIRHNSIGL